MRAWLCLFFASVYMVGCSTKPYDPPVIVKGAPEFQGLAHLLDPARPLDVVLVHGMCTHKDDWAYRAMDGLLYAVDVNLKPAAPQLTVAGAGPGPMIQVIQREDIIAGSKIRFTAIIWSPLTRPLKEQLKFDKTDEPLDCAQNLECKPVRAKYNGQFKDGLLNDCLADAMIYEGVSRPVMRGAMVAALSKVLDGSPAGVPLVLVSDSLGSKMVFDALSDMLSDADSSATKASGVTAAARLAQVFMNANQMPLLGLADQNVSQPPPDLMKDDGPPVDVLQKYLRLRKKNATVAELQNKMWPKPQPTLSVLKLVAFIDPNDLLSYRLRPSRYVTENVLITDVLVSNAKTYFGLFERPDTAHLDYDKNKAVATYIACGWPKSALCK
nr:hypothetical protein [uncultured Albidiferax sp.]